MTFYKIFTSHAYKYKYKLLLLILLTNTTSIINALVIPLITGDFIDILSVQPSYNDVINWIVILLILNLFSSIVGFFSSVVYAMTNTRMAVDYIVSTTEHIQNSSIEYFGQLESSYVTEQINNDSNAIIRYLLDFFLNGIPRVITFIISGYLLLKINSLIFIIFIVSLPLYLLIYFSFRTKIRETSLEFMNQQSAFFSESNRQLAMIDTVKMNAWLPLFKQDIRSVSHLFFHKLKKNLTILNLSSSISGIATIVTNILCMLIGGIGVVNGTVTLGELTIVTSYLNISISSLHFFIEFIQTFQTARVSLSRMNGHWDIETEESNEKIIASIHKIKLENINFSYTVESDLIQNFSYTFERGKVYSIIGRNGIGKSSLIRLIAGLYASQNGHITYNDDLLSEINLEHLRREKLAVVAQDPVVMKQSFFEDITYGLDLTRLDHAQYHEYISLFGLEHLESSREGNKLILSGGERQKSAIIRALIKQADVIIMDEPTSMIDHSSVNILLNIINQIKVNKIIILVSHDERVITHSDEIINLNEIENYVNKVGVEVQVQQG